MISETRMLSHWLVNIGICLMIISWLLVISVFPVSAADKTWGGGGDGTSWSDKNNWYPAEVPIAIDDVLIDIEDGEISADQTFTTKTLTIGGRESTILTTDNFVFGTVEPDEVTDSAIINRSGGKIIFSGSGIITLKGKYESSKQAAATSEPSFMFWVK